MKGAKKTLTKTSTIVAIADQVSTDLAGKTAVLGLKNRTYYTLDEVASPIWALLQKERSFNEIHQMLLQRYEVDAAQSERDLMAFLQKLADQDLILIK